MPKSLITAGLSHGKPCFELRGDTPELPPAPDILLMKDPATGRFKPGNNFASRARKALKSAHRGIATLNPAEVAPWVAPGIAGAAKFGLDLAERFPDPILRTLIGVAADHLAVATGLLALGTAKDGADPKALAESRAWFKELRAYVREVSALGAAQDNEREDPWAAFARVEGLAEQLDRPERETRGRGHDYSPDAEEFRADKDPND